MGDSLKDGRAPTVPATRTFAPLPTEPSRGPAEAESREGASSEPAERATLPGRDEASAVVGQVLGGRYRILEHLGSGGMGAVYRAEHVHMRKSVALKVLHREMTFLSEVVARFEREAVAAGRIEHPNVAAATDFGRLEDGSFYLVLEFVEGRSLSKVLSLERRLAVPRALGIARQVADALRAAHAAGVVHRDLKPDNVMLVAQKPDSELVKVLDFGIAKLHLDDANEVNQPALTQAGAVFGTPEYMAPEQAQGGDVDARADLYTLGVMLYEMLAGATPFQSDDLVVVLTRQMTESPAPLGPEIPAVVGGLVMALLEKQPAARIQTAAELVEHLDQLLSDLYGISPRSSAVAARATFASHATLETGRLLPGPWALRGRRLVERLKAPFARLPSLLRRRVVLRGHLVPLWLLVTPIGAVTLLAGFAVTIALFTTGPGGNAAGAPAARVDSVVEEETSERQRLAELTARAARGDAVAIAELRRLPKASLDAGAWLALGRGEAENARHVESLAAYREAVNQRNTLAGDRRLLLDVRRLTGLEPTRESALAFAAEGLGAWGLDLLYDVWSEARRDPKAAAPAQKLKELLDRPQNRARAAAPLRVALELQDAKGCNQYRDLLTRAAEHADERSLPVLRKLSARRGCGFLGFSDCYRCLRSGSALAAATRNAEARRAPSFRDDQAGAAPSTSAPATAASR